MTSTSPASTGTPATTARPATESAAPLAIRIGGIVGAVGAAAYISSFFLLADLSGREAVRSPLCVTANMLMAVGYAVLALSLGSLHPRLPRWATTTAAAGCLVVAALAWGMATFGADVAGWVTDERWDKPGTMTAVAFAPKMLLTGIGFAAVAFHGRRRRVISLGAAVFLGFAALVSALPVPHPPGALVGGLALTWAAATAAQTPDRPIGPQPGPRS
ncbi:hypothetical protein OG216_47170 (plasmid) [Streptomycetaceae bacterium NBC_01309]